MSLKNLENLVKAGHLKEEAFSQDEFNGFISSGELYLKDAKNPTLSPESKFQLAYNAAYSLSLAALRRQNFRPENRYIVFQTLPFTLGVGPEIWKVLDKCHNKRNLSQYQGSFDADDKLFADLIKATEKIYEIVKS